VPAIGGLRYGFFVVQFTVSAAESSKMLGVGVVGGPLNDDVTARLGVFGIHT